MRLFAAARQALLPWPSMMLSMAILQKKIDGVGRTGAPLVATSCPACIMQLTAGVKTFGVPAKVIHPPACGPSPLITIGTEALGLEDGSLSIRRR